MENEFRRTTTTQVAMKMKSRWIGVALGLTLWAASATAQTAKATTVILVRHAEKAATPVDDPPLTAEGEARARDLLDAIRDAGVSAIITTQFARTKATAQPTAAALGISPEIVSAGGATHVQDAAAAIRKHAGQTVLVVGHSNTVPAIVGALGAKQPPTICDSEYDNLYVVTIAADGKASVVHAKFGARAPVDAACASMR
ncbi:MAG: Phosphoglycerate mutase [Gemmatimonadetes bacterium]|nr:Phosphoglycerate mutase [Gemmatimonadota bacterium]